MILSGKSYREVQVAMGFRHRSSVWWAYRKVAVPLLQKRSAAWRRFLSGA
jgi:hypothetical protein